MEDDYESAQEAYLVGRYLKENGLSETLECFLRETPIKKVPKMQENMQSLPQIMREFRCLLKDREELKEKRRRMQQYEEILNLLFEELRDVNSFQPCAFASTDKLSTSPLSINKNNVMKVSPESQFISADINGSDAQLIEEFCLQNLNHHHSSNSGRMVPVVLPKRAMQSNMSSCGGLRGVVHKDYSTSNNTTRVPSATSEGQPIDSRVQMLQHHYNRIREHRRLHGRAKHRFVDKPISPISTFVAYSSLPVSSSKGHASSCAHKGREPMVNNSTQKHSREKKHVGSWVAEPHGHSNTFDCAHTQPAIWRSKICSERQPRGSKHSLKRSGFDCKDNSSFGDKGSAHDCRSNQSPEAQFNQRVSNEDNDIAGDGDANALESSSSHVRCDQKQGKESNHRHEIHRSVASDKQPLPYTKFLTNSSSVCSCPVDSAANNAAASHSVTSEDNQLIERNCCHRYVPCGGGLHYKAFLREKFFSTRRRQSTTIHQQELLIHRHDEQYCCSTTSKSSLDLSHDDDTQYCNSCGHNYTNVENEGAHVDAALLATETANLLERLLPLVANPGTMQSFISNLDTRSPHPSPRDHHMHNHQDRQQLCTEPADDKADSIRSQGIGEHTLTQRDSQKVDEILEESNIDDEASVLAELEAAVGETVDDILRRYILVSPPPH